MNNELLFWIIWDDQVPSHAFFKDTLDVFEWIMRPRNAEEDLNTNEYGVLLEAGASAKAETLK